MYRGPECSGSFSVNNAYAGLVGNISVIKILLKLGNGFVGSLSEKVEFGGLLGWAPVMPVNKYSCEAFISREGRIPAPIHSFKN